MVAGLLTMTATAQTVTPTVAKKKADTTKGIKHSVKPVKHTAKADTTKKHK